MYSLKLGTLSKGTFEIFSVVRLVYFNATFHVIFSNKTTTKIHFMIKKTFIIKLNLFYTCIKTSISIAWEFDFMFENSLLLFQSIEQYLNNKLNPVTWIYQSVSQEYFGVLKQMSLVCKDLYYITMCNVGSSLYLCDCKFCKRWCNFHKILMPFIKSFRIDERSNVDWIP